MSRVVSRLSYISGGEKLYYNDLRKQNKRYRYASSLNLYYEDIKEMFSSVLLYIETMKKSYYNNGIISDEYIDKYQSIDLSLSHTFHVDSIHFSIHK